MIKTVSLCPSCSDCPTVEVQETEVRIGEGTNTVRLTPTEWNVLVKAINAGELREIDA